MKNIVCFSGGKDSTAMLIHIIENNIPIDDIIYCDVGDWIWDTAKNHIQQVEKKLNVKIHTINITKELQTGFKRWGFPSYLNRWCTGFKRDKMKEYLKNKYGENEKIIQYIGYCSDEQKRTNKKLYSTYQVEYPLVKANITTKQALQICKQYGFNFGGIYKHHTHFNCWLCPLQKVNELQYIHDNKPKKWNKLRDMQYQCDGYYSNHKTIFDYEKQFWEKNRKTLINKKIKARKKYNKKTHKINNKTTHQNNTTITQQ